MKCIAPEVVVAATDEMPGEKEDVGETEAILVAVAQAVEQRDAATARHCERLALTGVALGMALHLGRTSLMALYRGGFLHDVGKIGIPDAILFKPGALSAAEWVVMRSHTVRGEEICQHVRALKAVLPIIRHHHERWDGSGYPDGLRGNQIPLLARVVQIADIYDALISPRPYKRAYPVKQVLGIMKKETERGWRDPELMSLFFELHDGVISRIDELSLVGEGRLERIREALGCLNHALTESDFSERDFPDFRASDRMSFPLLQCGPRSGSPWGATGR